MIDREYFEQELPEQLEAAQRPLRLTLTLVSGETFRVRRVGNVGPGWAIFEFYPPTVEGVVRGGRRERRLTNGPGPHWITVALESVSHVTLSVAGDEPVETGGG